MTYVFCKATSGQRGGYSGFNYSSLVVGVASFVYGLVLCSALYSGRRRRFPFRVWGYKHVALSVDEEERE